MHGIFNALEGKSDTAAARKIAVQDYILPLQILSPPISNFRFSLLQSLVRLGKHPLSVICLIHPGQFESISFLLFPCSNVPTFQVKLNRSGRRSGNTRNMP